MGPNCLLKSWRLCKFGESCWHMFVSECLYLYYKSMILSPYFLQHNRLCFGLISLDDMYRYAHIQLWRAHFWKLGYSMNFPAFPRWNGIDTILHEWYKKRCGFILLKLLYCEVGPVVLRLQIAGRPFIDLVSWQAESRKCLVVSPHDAVDIYLSTKCMQLK